MQPIFIFSVTKYLASAINIQASICGRTSSFYPLSTTRVLIIVKVASSSCSADFSKGLAATSTSLKVIEKSSNSHLCLLNFCFFMYMLLIPTHTPSHYKPPTSPSSRAWLINHQNQNQLYCQVRTYKQGI
ncbi:hypothetical protein GOODEAATRI_010609 [Goodea atripinnis]|uniref:Uncharacterized protein n=1 Tax=Goodea atripinnis TaxID=208336 RepID=A0ABV0PMJ7_9TELE